MPVVPNCSVVFGVLHSSAFWISASSPVSRKIFTTKLVNMCAAHQR